MPLAVKPAMANRGRSKKRVEQAADSTLRRASHSRKGNLAALDRGGHADVVAEAASLGDEERPTPLPLGLTDTQLDMVYVAAKPLDPDLRGQFLERVAQTLTREPMLGDGAVHRACREAQKVYWHAPDLSKANDYSKYR
jgi:hypothetical protein